MFEPEEEQAHLLLKERKKPTKSVLPSVRTKGIFNELGYTTQLVERFIPGVGIRKDFLGCIDVVAMSIDDDKIIGIQCFSTAWSAHKKKIIDGEEPYALDGVRFWLELGYTEMWFLGFRKLKVKRGGSAIKWVPRWGEVLIIDDEVTLIERDNFKISAKRWWE